MYTHAYYLLLRGNAEIKTGGTTEAPSTHYNAFGTMTPTHPADIKRGNCVCGQKRSFADTVAFDCMGVGMFTPSERTCFGDIDEVVTAFIHHLKAQILGNAFNVPLHRGDIFRGKIFDDSREKIYVMCSLVNWIAGYEGERTAGATAFATVKHKLLWIIPLETFRNIRDQAFSAGTNPSQQQLNVWREGTIHVVSAGPLAPGSWRLPLARSCV